MAINRVVWKAAPVTQKGHNEQTTSPRAYEINLVKYRRSKSGGPADRGDRRIEGPAGRLRI
ncbi:MAG: hypothetical protein QNL80_00645 [Akkermansiaceae bacterium]